MNYSNYIEKTTGREVDRADDAVDPDRLPKAVKVRGTDSIKRIKETLQFANYKDQLSGAQILKYSIYESKMQAYLSQAVIFGVAFAIFRRISFAKLDWNYKPCKNCVFTYQTHIPRINFSSQLMS